MKAGSPAFLLLSVNLWTQVSDQKQSLSPCYTPVSQSASPTCLCGWSERGQVSLSPHSVPRGEQGLEKGCAGQESGCKTGIPPQQHPRGGIPRTLWERKEDQHGAWGNPQMIHTRHQPSSPYRFSLLSPTHPATTKTGLYPFERLAHQAKESLSDLPKITQQIRCRTRALTSELHCLPTLTICTGHRKEG
jgi:hypothetical protein